MMREAADGIVHTGPATSRSSGEGDEHKMAKVLFLAHRVPFPPNKGDKIRAYHVLEHLAAKHEVWLGAGADDPADMQHLDMARTRYRDAYFGALGPVKRALNMARGGLAGAPLSVARFHHAGLMRWVKQVLTDVKPDIIYVYSSAVAQYLPMDALPKTGLIIDFVDADAEKWRAYAEKAPIPLRWIFGAEFRRLVRFDRAALALATAGILISETERRLLSNLLAGSDAKLQVMANGVDTDYFRPTAEPCDGRGIVLCGTMDYRPNIDGAIWFAREILPQVRARFPQAVFRIVGARPTPQVTALGSLENVEVTGSVPDVRPYLAAAAVVVAPLRIARGIQNKVLEGMAAGRPMVATPEALDGIDASPGRDLLVGADAASFADAVSDVLMGLAPSDLGECARRHVVSHYQWAEQLRVLDRIIVDITPDSSGEAPA